MPDFSFSFKSLFSEKRRGGACGDGAGCPWVAGRSTFPQILDKVLVRVENVFGRKSL